MNLDPNDLLLFARVVDEGNFSRAAARLGVPKSTLSRRLAALETQLKERLLLRTTRKLSVTDFGQALLQHARQVGAEVEAALALSQHRQAEPSGRLRVSMPGDFAAEMLDAFLAGFLARYPAISLELDLSPRRVDLIGENFDVALRMGDLPDDASLAARRIATFTTGLYASPRYLRRRGVPHEPEALMEHDTLRLPGRGGEPGAWTLRRGEARWQGAPPLRASANAPSVLLRLACSDAGIAGLTEHFAAPALQSGELVQVLGDWSMAPIDAWAVFPGRRLMPARTRVFLDALVEEFSAEKCAQTEAKAAAARGKLER